MIPCGKAGAAAQVHYHVMHIGGPDAYSIKRKPDPGRTAQGRQHQPRRPCDLAKPGREHSQARYRHPVGNDADKGLRDSKVQPPRRQKQDGENQPRDFARPTLALPCYRHALIRKPRAAWLRPSSADGPAGSVGRHS